MSRATPTHRYCGRCHTYWDSCNEASLARELKALGWQRTPLAAGEGTMMMCPRCRNREQRRAKQLNAPRPRLTPDEAQHFVDHLP